MKYTVRITGAQHAELRSHLFPGDGYEAIALLLCGRRAGTRQHVFTVRKIIKVPHNVCDRQPSQITWPTAVVDDLIKDAYGKGQAIIKIHSHYGDCDRFSATDDDSDRNIFASLTSLLDDGLPHASLLMLQGGEIYGRVLGEGGEVLGSISLVMSVGDDLRLWIQQPFQLPGAFTFRHAQAFGIGTAQLLQILSIAVVGCSGTGSIVVEQLARLGVGHLVLVDPDYVEEKNLNRILNSNKEDALLRRPKVYTLASAIARMGLEQDVLPLAMNLITPEAIKCVAECDVVFGCMDGAEGRHTLNRLATFYNLPYFDLGVRLDADGLGGIRGITGAVHYLQPACSSLLSRGVYSLARVEAEAMLRAQPDLYKRQVQEGYLRGVEDDRPAVIAVNMFFASLAVNDFLARLHPYRNESNGNYSYIGGSLSEMRLYTEGDGDKCEVLRGHLGKGDVEPLLERPSLS